MNWGIIKKGASWVAKEFVKHQSEILLVSGVVTAVAATTSAVKATVKSVEEVKEENKKRFASNDEPMTKTEVVKKEAKNYVWTLIFLGTSIGCQFGGYKASIRRIAALSTALKVSEEMYEEYKKDVEKTVKLSESQSQDLDKRVHNQAVENVVVAGDTDYIIRIDGQNIRENVSELRLKLEKFRSDYYLSGYQDPVTVADLHDYLGIRVCPSDYDRKIYFNGDEWYTLYPGIEGSRLFIDVDYTTRDIEKY